MDGDGNNPYVAPEARIAMPDRPRRTRRQCIRDIARGIGLLMFVGTPTAAGLGLLAIYIRDVFRAPDHAYIPISSIGTNMTIIGGLYATFFFPLSIIVGTLAGLLRPRLSSRPLGIAGFSALTMLLPLGVAAFAPQQMKLTALSGIAQGISLPYTIAATCLVWLFVRKRRRPR